VPQSLNAHTDTDPDCVHCNIANDARRANVVHRGPLAVGYVPAVGSALGHTVFVPRLHVPDLLALGLDSAVALHREILGYVAGLRGRLRAPRLNLLAAAWADDTDEHGHLEIHLAPRWPAGDPRGPADAAEPADRSLPRL